MEDPKLRGVNVKEPYALGKFPEGFAKIVAGELAASMALGRYDVEGKDWELIFAKAIGAEWKPSVVGLDDILVPNLSAAWGAKTIKHLSPFTASKIRLISGRNSLSYSYSITDIMSLKPSQIGEMVLGIWNERVAALFKKYKTLRTVTMLKGAGLEKISIFEKPTVRYESSQYDWVWNPRQNLIGISNDGSPKFTWQPSGSQFTIHETVPDNALHISITPPSLIKTNDLLRTIGFSDKSYSSYYRNRS